jgi:hypothetical protein
MSEVGYASLLQNLIRDANLPVHLHVEQLGPGAGDPLSRIEMAVSRIGRLQSTRGAPKERFALLDFDQAENDLQRAAQARTLASKNGITIVWQRPCFEAVLLRHMVGKAANRPPDTPGAIRALEKDWPEYRKPMSAADLARRIDRAGVLRAAGVEPDLQGLLRCIGLI